MGGGSHIGIRVPLLPGETDRPVARRRSRRNQENQLVAPPPAGNSDQAATQKGNGQQIVFQAPASTAPQGAVHDDRLSWLKNDIVGLQNAFLSLGNEMRTRDHDVAGKAQKLYADVLLRIEDGDAAIMGELKALASKIEGHSAKSFVEAQREEAEERVWKSRLEDFDRRLDRAIEAADKAATKANEAAKSAQEAKDQVTQANRRHQEHLGHHGRAPDGSLSDANLSPLVASAPAIVAAVVASRPKSVLALVLGVLSAAYETVRIWSAPLLHFLGYPPAGGSQTGGHP